MIKFIELHMEPELVWPLNILLEEYGTYMYDDLGLKAGKKDFYKEIQTSPNLAYQLPNGTFILAKVEEKIAGCVGIKRFSNDYCEMKRMYIRPTFRGMGIGKMLCSYVIRRSKELGYSRIYLDTNLEMKEAVNLYLNAGFKMTSPYCLNENANPIFMEYSF